MKIAVVTEVSTKQKNRFVLEALEPTGHTIINAGMSDTEGEVELGYIQTGLITALLLNSGAADLVVGGCGTGQGYIQSASQYPNVFCGLVLSPLDAWLFRQINGGNCISLALNKDFGWAAEQNIKFIFERFFSVESGAGYPAYRRDAQKYYRDQLFALSASVHIPMPEAIRILPDEAILPAIQKPGILELVKEAPAGAEMAAAIQARLAR